MKKTITKQNPKGGLLRLLVCALVLLGFTATNANAQNYTLSSCGAGTMLISSGTLAVSGDDVMSGAISMPFSFSFYGTSYSSVYVSSNGFTSFNGGSSACCGGYTLPNTFGQPYVALAHTDLYSYSSTPGTAGSIYYSTVGSAPNRIFVVHFQGLAPCCTPSSNVTGEIQFYETTNEVRIVVSSISLTNYTTMGIAKGDNATSVVVSGRNAVAGLTASNECWSFIPGAFSSCGAGTMLISTGTLAVSGDDVMSGAISMPFSFSFYGTSYSSVYVSSNGFTSFNGGSSACCGGYTLPNTFGQPYVALAHTDLYSYSSTPGTAGSIYYSTVGSAPNRIFVVHFQGVAPCCTPSSNVTGEIQFYETTNEVRIVVSSISLTNYTTMGVAKGDNITAAAVAGRNAVAGLTASNECWSFLSPAVVSPSISSFTPSSGCSGTGTVVITGTNFTGATSVTIGGTAVSSYVVNSATQITAIVGAGTTGTIAVTTSNGTATSAGTFTVNPLAATPTPVASPNPICTGGNSLISAYAAASAYCVPTVSYGCAYPDIITNVTIGSINRNSSCDNLSGANGYSNFPTSTATTTLTAGVATPLSVTTGGDIEGAAVWIDYNQNGVFDASEQLLSGYAGTNPATYSASITVPTSAFNGQTRMRVRCIYATNPNGNPCGSTTYGEIEDYTVTITGGTTVTWSPATFLSSTTGATVTATAATATTTYTATATSSAGCAAAATGSVTLVVNTPPTITCIGNQSANAAAGVCTAVVSYGAPTTTGIPAPAITYAFTGATTASGSGTGSGSTFNGGVTTVTLTATNSCGTATCSFTVTVNDTQPPVVNGINGANNSSTGGAGDCFFANGATFTPGEAEFQIVSDNCSSLFTIHATNDIGENLTASGLGTGFWYIYTENYPVGVTHWTVVVTDAAGNSTTVTYTETVTDNEAPVITCPATANITTDAGMCTSTASIGTATATDNCGVASVTPDITTYSLGTNTVTWTATDIHGNTSTCTQTVNVTDAEAPMVTAPAAVSVCSLTAPIAVTLGTASGTDNCGTVTFTNDAPSTFPFGNTTVTWTGNDGHGNTATATQIVTVNETPVGTNSNMTICNTAAVNYNLTSSVAGSTYTWTTNVVPFGSVIGENPCVGGCGNFIGDVLTNTGFVHGDVYYTITPTSPAGCAGAPFTLDVIVGATPATPGAISGPSVICGVTSATYSIAPVPETSTGGYFWTVPTGVTGMTITGGQGTTAITVTMTAGTIIGDVTVTASNSCGTSAAQTLHVTRKPAVPGSISGPATACGLGTATYSVAPVFGATSTLWTVPAGVTIVGGAGTTLIGTTSASTINNSITVTFGGTFIAGNIGVSAVNACGNIPGTSLFVTGAAPATPGTITGATNVCGMTTANYSIPNVAYATGYTWVVPSWMTINSGQGTTMINVTATGTPVAGPLTVAATNACGTGTARVMNLVISAVAPGAITGPASICGLTTATYSVAPVAGATSYQWQLSGMTGWSISGPATGTSITIITTVTSGTTASGIVAVRTSNSCSATPSNWTSKAVSYCHSAIANNNAPEVNGNTFSALYPNPTSDEFKVDVVSTSSTTEDITLQVYDVLGNLVISQKHQIVSGTTTLNTNIETYKNGMYFVRLVDKDANTVYSQTVIKQ